MQSRLHLFHWMRSLGQPGASAQFWRRMAVLLTTAGFAAVLWAAPAAAQPAQPAQSAQPVHDFDAWCKWRRGAQAWGNLTQSSEQVHQGKFAGKLAYDFPTGEDANFVVFQCPKPLAGTPEYLSVWVYGDGSGNLLNAWVQDATGLRWQFAFGPVDFNGWQRMSAHLAPGQPWPNGPLDGSSTDTVVYPIRFDGIVLDNPGSDAAQGVIYLDDLQASSLPGSSSSAAAPAKQATQPAQKPAPKLAPTPTFAPTPTPDMGDAGASGDAAVAGDGAAPAQDPEVDFRADATAIQAGQCTTLRWTVRNVRQYFVDGKGKAGDTGKQEVCPEVTTTYTLRIKTLADEQQDYTVAIAVTGEPPARITVGDAEVLSEPLDLKGVNDNPGIEAVAVAECAQARKLKCTDMSQYRSNPSFGKTTQACLVWVERGLPFGSIDIAVRRKSPNPEKELWTSSRDSLGNFACIGIPVKIGQQGSYAAVLTANGVNQTIKWSVK